MRIPFYYSNPILRRINGEYNYLREKILLIDDDPSIVDLLDCMFKRDEYEVVKFTSANLALEYMTEENIFAQPNYFDLIITDLHMQGMDGLEFAKIVKDKLPDLPILIISGYSSKRDLRLFIANNEQVSFIAKPFDFRQIMEAADNLIIR